MIQPPQPPIYYKEFENEETAANIKPPDLDLIFRENKKYYSFGRLYHIEETRVPRIREYMPIQPEITFEVERTMEEELLLINKRLLQNSIELVQSLAQDPYSARRKLDDYTSTILQFYFAIFYIRHKYGVIFSLFL
eukprot:TRINITY_DN6594_c0_g1_i1.p1 TRINITY_DN6594_c0_g1~~TRINITY_DN6594_c0_g1_i1.p1  ORF type:complete len:136 (-),score=22.50 TRINITY_DN6594_c0_g1_i1:36-443(-)